MKLATLFLSLSCGALLAADQPSRYRISGPYHHDNLSLFLVHGAGGGKSYVPLKQALEQRKVVVRETGSVNELTIENLSGQEIYIQGGDIVKGGQQDRVLTTDLVLPPKSGKIPIAAFCVEHGRWSRRGSEAVTVFASSTDVVATRPLKMAVNASKKQEDVWREVARAQEGLARTAGVAGDGGAGVRSLESPSSLQLSLESRPVAAATDAYLKALNGVTAGKPDALGVVVVINGGVNSADIYSSPPLFVAMWPKLLKAGAVEAVQLLEQGKPFAPASASAVEAFLRAADTGKESFADVGGRMKVVTRESDKQLVFESSSGGPWIHRNYIHK